MKDFCKVIVFIVIFSLLPNVFCQNSVKKTRQNKKKQTKEITIVQPVEVEVADRCADCLFAMQLVENQPFGFTVPLQGYGYVNEINKDKQTPQVFEKEHNSIWYKLKCTTSGKLIITITPKSKTDNYDFLVYKYTDNYFCNRIEKNRIKPLRSVLSLPTNEGVTGLSLNSNKSYILSNDTSAFARYIDVEQGDEFMIVLDNTTDGGLGHKILCEVIAPNKPLKIKVFDNKKQPLISTIKINEQSVESSEYNLKRYENTNYNVTVSHSGYLSQSFSTSYLNNDTVKNIVLSSISKNSLIPTDEVFFDFESDTLFIMQQSYYVLDSLVNFLNTYENISIEIIGRIQTDGLNIQKDMQQTLQRAELIKLYLMQKGIKNERLFARGSTKNELLQQIQTQNKTNKTIFPRCEFKIK